MSKLTKFLACAAIVVTMPAAATNILINPGFESGALSPWYQDNDFGSVVDVDWFVTSADAHSGTFSAEDNGNKSIRQDFAGILASDINTISFWAKHIDPNVTDLAYDFEYSDNSLEEFIVSTTGTDWNFFDVTSDLNLGKTLTGFAIYGNIFGVSRVDDVVIDATSGAVPEPASWALMIAGFGLTGMAMRGRRARVAMA